MKSPDSSESPLSQSADRLTRQHLLQAHVHEQQKVQARLPTEVESFVTTTRVPTYFYRSERDDYVSPARLRPCTFELTDSII